MSNSILRRQLIRLAAARPELRADLLPLLKQDADPASHDENKPQSFYGLPPRGVQAKFPRGVEMTIDEVAEVVGPEFKEMNENPPDSVLKVRDEMQGKRARFHEGPEGEREFDEWLGDQPEDFQKEWAQNTEEYGDQFKTAARRRLTRRA